MIGVTGATGQLGRLVVAGLLEKVSPQEVVALARNPAKAQDLAQRGVSVRLADYDKPDTLEPALAGVDRLVMISASEVGKRTPQHRAVLNAAKRAKVRVVAYTSLLRADTSPLGLAPEHRETEAMLRASGLEFVLLRNGWYTENYAMSIPAALAHRVLMGCAGDARLSCAARVDYAAAAVAVILNADSNAGRTYELAGDTAFTLGEFAAEVARQSGKPVRYQNLSEAEYRAALVQAGLPEAFAALLADSDAAAAKGALFDDGGALGRLIGRPTTPMAEVVAATLRAQ